MCMLWVELLRAPSISCSSCATGSKNVSAKPDQLSVNIGSMCDVDSVTSVKHNPPVLIDGVMSEIQS